jgi:putative oxidoreductase
MTDNTLNNGWYRTMNIGLLIMRVGLGIMYMVHGWPKISGGVEKWTGIGGGMENLGIHFAPAFWGFMAALAEFGGGLCLALGIFFRPAVAVMIFTMIVAIIHHVTAGDGFGGYSHPAENAFALLGMLLTGPGAYSFLAYWQKTRRQQQA